MEDHDLFFGEDFPEGVITDTHINIPGLEPMPLNHAEYFAWSRRMLVHREQVMRQCSQDHGARRLHEALCCQPFGLGQVYFAVTFCWIYEPREDDDMAMAPYILYPRQAQLVFAIDAAMRRKKGPDASIAVPKARGVGATWGGALDDLWRWRFKKSYQGRFFSKNEDMVDQMGNSDSYFWKLDYLADNLPSWLLPEGYSTKRGVYRTHMKMINPETGSAIIGEATTSGIGVGGRATKYTGDEVSRLREFRRIHGQLQETTNHCVYFSTHNVDYGTDFWDMTHGLNGWDHHPVIFPMPWDCVPGRDEQWLSAARRTMTDEMFQREVMMNPHAGISSWVYPTARGMGLTRHVFRPGAGLGITGLDDGYDDDFAIGFAQWDRGAQRLIFLDSYSNSHKPISFYGSLLRGMPENKYAWDSEALRLIPWILHYKLWQNLHVGDRHGDNTDLTSGSSPWLKLQTEFGITVLPSSHINNDRKSRRNALSEVLAQADFADTPGAHAMLEAIQNHRFPEDKTGSNFTTEHRTPIHDQTSHLTTMAEYIATYVVETLLGRSYALGGIAAQGSSNNNWMKHSNDTFGRDNKTRIRPPEKHAKLEGAHNGWIR